MARPSARVPLERGRAGFSRAVHRQEFVCGGVANRIEPLTAALRVPPALSVRPPDVVTEVQILRPGRVIDTQRRTERVRFTTINKLSLITRPAIGAADLHHPVQSPERVGYVNARRRRLRLRR